jgi:hypothetical protein
VGGKEKVIAHGKAHLVEIQELVRVKNTSGKRHIETPIKLYAPNSVMVQLQSIIKVSSVMGNLRQYTPGVELHQCGDNLTIPL